MPYDGSGNFTIINSFEQDRINDISIDSAKMDANFNDVASGLSNAMLRSGSSAMFGPLNMANYKIQNVADGTVNSDAANKGQLETLSSACVKLSGNQTIAGTKTFSSSPVVPTKGNSDNSQAPATTAHVKNILAALYPVGSLYITTNNSATCPLASLISGSSWSLVEADKALWTSNRNGNTTINAGLPNISGTFGSGCMMNWQDSYASGAFYRATISQYPQNAGGTDGGSNVGIGFQASRSNSIYGNSSTVQPPAYRVNVWRRTA